MMALILYLAIGFGLTYFVESKNETVSTVMVAKFFVVTLWLPIMIFNFFIKDENE